MKRRENYFALSKKDLISRQYYNYYRNLVTKKIRIAKINYYEALFLRIKNNVRKTWKVINSIISRKVNPGNNTIKMIVVNGLNLTTDYEISEAFNDHFSSIGRRIDESFPSPIDLNAISEFNSVISPTNSFFFSPISSYDVESIIDKMENKSSHIDTYSIRIVKHLSTILSPILCKLINKSFQMGHFPEFCKIARVVPLYKSGDSTNVNNYRPISILPIFSKNFEKIVYQQIFGYFQKFGLLSKNQFGFRKNLSTSDAIIDMTQFVYDSLDKGKTVISFFFDFTKAFDCVNHSVLLSKLEHYGIRGLANDWFKSYLSNRNQCVVINGISSTTMPIEYGVPQGSTLGPLLFLIFINDFPSCSNFFKFTLFADDSTLTCCFDHSDLNLIKNELESQLLPVNQWLSLNRIKVNSTKSNFMIFSYRKNMKIDHVNFGTNRLFQVHSTKFLGIYIDEH